MILTQESLQVLSMFSSVLFSLPTTVEISKRAETLYRDGCLVREKQHDARLGIDRWAYRRTEKGSRAIGA